MKKVLIKTNKHWDPQSNYFIKQEPEKLWKLEHTLHEGNN